MKGFPGWRQNFIQIFVKYKQPPGWPCDILWWQRQNLSSFSFFCSRLISRNQPHSDNGEYILEDVEEDSIEEVAKCEALEPTSISDGLVDCRITCLVEIGIWPASFECQQLPTIQPYLSILTILGAFESLSWGSKNPHCNNHIVKTHLSKFMPLAFLALSTIKSTSLFLKFSF